jgi:hypothetical protein
VQRIEVVADQAAQPLAGVVRSRATRLALHRRAHAFLITACSSSPLLLK